LISDLLRDVEEEEKQASIKGSFKSCAKIAMNSTYGKDALCPCCHRSCLEMTNKQIEELKDVNKKLGNEIDELVHKYDTMNRRYLDAYNNYRDVQDKLDDARDRIKLQNSKIDLLDNKNKKLEKAAEDAAKLTEENKELIKVLNIYQAITDIDYDFLTDTGMVRLNGADGAGRVFVHDGDAARALYSASIKYQ
jgi:DNA repair exonuclease SbcCD ATPase subunit